MSSTFKRALVVGCGKRVWADVEAAHDLCPKFDTYYCVKHAGIDWDGGPFVWVTLHPEFMKVPSLVNPQWVGEPGYCAQRKALGLHDNYTIVSPLTTEVGAHDKHQMDRHVTYRWPGMCASGSSGFFAIKIAIDDGHDRVVLAGIPMSPEEGHYREGKFRRTNTWAPRDSFLGPWTSHKEYYADKTRSLSGGWTEALLGRPTKEWLGISPSTESGEMPDDCSVRLKEDGTQTNS